MSREVLSLTTAAIDRIRHLVETQGNGAPGIKIGVRTAGCSGMSYTIDFVEEIQPNAELVEAEGVKIVIDPEAVMYLVGTEMDFVEDKLVRLQIQQSQRSRPLRLRRILHSLDATCAIVDLTERDLAGFFASEAVEHREKKCRRSPSSCLMASVRIWTCSVACR